MYMSTFTDTLKIITYLNSRGNRWTLADDVANDLRISQPWARKLMQSLVRQNILVSKRGKSGGFKMKTCAGGMTMLDVLQRTQGPVATEVLSAIPSLLTVDVDDFLNAVPR